MVVKSTIKPKVNNRVKSKVVLKKKCPKCNNNVYNATRKCNQLVNSVICGYIFKRSKFTNKVKTTNKVKIPNKIELDDDYLYEIKIDDEYMDNIKLDDRYIDEINLDHNNYFNEIRLDNKFIDEIKLIKKELFKKGWKDNTYNNLDDIELL